MDNQHDAIKLTEGLVDFNLTHSSPQLYLKLKRRLGPWWIYYWPSWSASKHQVSMSISCLLGIWDWGCGGYFRANVWCQNSSLIMTLLIKCDSPEYNSQSIRKASEDKNSGWCHHWIWNKVRESCNHGCFHRSAQSSVVCKWK